MKLAFGPPASLHPYFGYRSAGRLVLTARALRPRTGDFKAGGGKWRAIRTMLGQFATREVMELAVTLEVAGPDGTVHRHQSVTDREGFVRFDIALDPPLPLPQRTAWENVHLSWTNRAGPQMLDAPVLAPGLGERLAVVSDIDDTVIETGITGGLASVRENWDRVFTEMPGERLMVPGADGFYSALSGGPAPVSVGSTVPAEHRPFFYVSSSPWNLYAYLVAFLSERKLPLGPLLLRDWGLNRATFGSGTHGAHKIGAINDLLAFYPDLSFALIGDDSQGDLTAYAEVVRACPGRVAAVFIRKVGAAMSAEELAAKDTIRVAGVPLWLGDDWQTGQAFLAEAGLASNGATAQIVRTVERLGDSDGDDTTARAAG